VKEKADFSGWFFETWWKGRNFIRTHYMNWFNILFCHAHGVETGKGVIFNGMPLIRRAPGSRIFFDDKCTFNSSRLSVLAGLYKRCTFVTIKRGAEIYIGKKTGLSGVLIVAAKRVIIGSNVLIGAHSTIIDTDFHDSDPGKREDYDNVPAHQVVIEDNVFIGFNCLVTKGVTIGTNSVIGANSVVLTSIPPNSIALGNPCKVIIRRNWESS
jgi:acetyltransferase-like isoleucine patch superfamily enzyme